MQQQTQQPEILTGAALSHHQLMEAIDIIDALEAENTALRQKLTEAKRQLAA